MVKKHGWSERHIQNIFAKNWSKRCNKSRKQIKFTSAGMSSFKMRTLWEKLIRNDSFYPWAPWLNGKSWNLACKLPLLISGRVLKRKDALVLLFYQIFWIKYPTEWNSNWIAKLINTPSNFGFQFIFLTEKLLKLNFKMYEKKKEPG